MKTLIFFLFSATFVTFINAQTFTLKSEDIGGQITNKQVFNGFGCTGENVSPQLSWSDAPEHTKSFAITVYDPDAPTGSGWWHWVAFDIPANVSQLKRNAGNISKSLMPEGSVQSITDYGQAGYGGPCPPEGDDDHQYIFTIYALSIDKLGLDANASPALVGYYLHTNAIAKASIVSYFKR